MSIRNLNNHLAIGLLLATLSLASFVPRVAAQTRTVANVQETDDKVKVDLYTRFVDNYKTDKPVAYQTAKDYLQRYAKENDQYSQYVQLWVADYERGERLKQLRGVVYVDRNFVEAFKLGKQVMAENPNHLDSLVALGNAGYLAASARNENYNTEAVGYAQKAIQMIEGGKSPEDWAPFKGKSDTLASLYNTVGLLKLKSAPDEAIDALLKTASLDSDFKKLPSLYYYLASAYQSGPYAKLSAEYQKNFAGKPETPESKQAIEKLNQVIDRMIDAYARAVAAAGTDPKQAANKTAWLANATTFYKFRHQDSDAGLKELIDTVMSKPPLPSPGSSTVTQPTPGTQPTHRDVTVMEALRPAEINRTAAPSVVLLVTVDKAGKPSALGSGFFVKRDVIATNFHVIQGASEVYAKLTTLSGEKTMTRITRVIARNERQDLALVKIEGVMGRSLPLAQNDDLEVGDEIYTLGNPEGLEGTFSQGIISGGNRVIMGANLMQFSAPISPGSSGGPLLNKRGEVVGVVSSFFKSGQSLNFAVPVAILRTLLTSNPD